MAEAAASGISIRRAVPGDAAVLARLYRDEVEAQRAWAADSFTVKPDFEWAAWVSAKLVAAGTAVFVAERNGAIVGFAEARLRKAGNTSGGQAPRARGWRAWARRIVLRRRGPAVNAPAAASPIEPRSTGFIEEVFVNPDARRQGIGLALLHTAREWLLAAGAAELLGSIWWNNDASRALFTRAGFQASRVVVRAESVR